MEPENILESAELRYNIELIDRMIEENNNTDSVGDTTLRFRDAVWLDEIQKSNILIAGIGGIGSWLALLISRMRPQNLLLMDNDSVELVNMSGQLYRTSDIGKLKVNALSETLREYSSFYNIMSIGSLFDEESEAYDIMICGFDNMKARKVYFNKWLERVKNTPIQERGKCLFIDGRLNAEKFQIISITGTDYYGMKKYLNEYLFDDSDVVDNVCSFKQTTYCAAMIASFMCNTLVNFASHSISRPVLFFQEYDAELMSLKQES